MIHRKVKFKGEIYWHHNDSGVDNISPLDHYTEDGELLADPLYDFSYAIIEFDNIMRFGESIGKVSELEEVKE